MIRLAGLTRVIAALLAPAAPVVPAPATAAAAPPVDAMSLYLSAGISLPSDPPELAEFWDTAPAAAAAWGVRFSPLWEVVASLTWQRFPADEAAQVEDLLLSGPGGVLEVRAIDGRDATALTVTAEARFHVPTEGRRVLPYLSFGWGYFDVSTSDATVTPADPSVGPVLVPGDTDTAFAVTIGGGLQLPVSARARIVLDTGYTVGFTEPVSTQYLPLRVGLGLGI